jgi:hypothetical protein
MLSRYQMPTALTIAAETGKLLACCSEIVAFSTSNGRPYASMRLGKYGAQVLPLRSEAFRNYLINALFGQ